MRWAWIFFLTFLAVPHADAHQSSEAYLTLGVETGQVTGVWEIPLRALELVTALDADANGEISWGEILAREKFWQQFVEPNLAFSAGGESCPMTWGRPKASKRQTGGYLALPFSAACSISRSDESSISLRYQLFQGIDDRHRVLVTLRGREGRDELFVLSPVDGPREVPHRASPRSSWAHVKDFIIEGVWHIWIGFDHVLFLLSLLLPAVGTREERRAGMLPSFSGAMWRVVGVATAFTIAHSITLSLAVLGIVNFPSRAIESIIALSVAVAAVNNLLPLYRERYTWAVTFFFGLVHGFGFASVLAELGLTAATRAVSLVSFNLGVELGQLAIIVAAFPVLFILRNTAVYRFGLLRAGSAAVVLISCYWLYERAFS